MEAYLEHPEASAATAPAEEEREIMAELYEDADRGEGEEDEEEGESNLVPDTNQSRSEVETAGPRDACLKQDSGQITPTLVSGMLSLASTAPY